MTPGQNVGVVGVCGGRPAPATGAHVFSHVRTCTHAKNTPVMHTREKTRVCTHKK